ncbi:unnamed protein product [Hydatigera taeniaeformis]|uniref:Protein kinase domain-containing protein n=1 Tax=Hydatigena taeniaeformis TaxID=6205 RepID=A0A3P7FCC5_HYDTA|nr:unnamed protein product [Hydatigera taeniaeformis]
MEPKQSKFISVLYYSFLVHGSPVLIISKGSGIDLQDLISYTGGITEKSAIFYTSEIICGLEHLHALQIVHLDIKPANVLLTDTGHVMISDFDRSYDITREAKPPTSLDFTGTAYFMAPEIIQRKVITTKADVWSLGILMAVLVCGLKRLKPSTLNEITESSKRGTLAVKVFANFSGPLKSFFNACLQYHYRGRASVAALKRLRFYKSVDWNQVAAGGTRPPYKTSEIPKPASRMELKADPHDPSILAAAYGKDSPQVNGHFLCKKDGKNKWFLRTHPPSLFKLPVARKVLKKDNGCITDFHFINPRLSSNVHKA